MNINDFNMMGQGGSGDLSLQDNPGLYSPSLVQKDLKPISGSDSNGAQAPGGLHFTQGNFVASPSGMFNALRNKASRRLGIGNVF